MDDDTCCRCDGIGWTLHEEKRRMTQCDVCAGSGVESSHPSNEELDARPH